MKYPNQIVIEKRGQPMTSSRKVAEVFGKRHDHVLRDIEKLKNSLLKIGEPNSDFKSGKSQLPTIEKSSYKDRGKTYPEYLLNRDAFSLLVMGFTGKRALVWKIQFIEAFNQMESLIKSIQTAKLEFPAFTDAIMLAHDEPKHYHFSNEINMINRIVLGMTASQFKIANGIDKKAPSIRPYLTTEQITGIEMLQRVDIGLIVAVPDYESRKKMLEQYYYSSRLRLSA